MTYARGTEVTIESSRAEIERLLNKRSADGISVGYSSLGACIQWKSDQRLLRFVLRYPKPDGDEFRWVYRKSRGRMIRHKERNEAQRRKAFEGRCRELWRALLLSIKAKLEAIEAGIAVFDEEFFSHIVNPETNMTVYETFQGQLQLAYQGNPELRLPAPEPPHDADR